jgi:hypothetical protein
MKDGAVFIYLFREAHRLLQYDYCVRPQIQELGERRPIDDAATTVDNLRTRNTDNRFVR